MNTPTITPGTPGAARVEYIACREDVEAMLAKGYSARMAFEAMKVQGRMTCSYSAFCDYVRGGGKRKHSKSKKPLPSGLPQAGNRPGFIVPKTDAQRSFGINPVDPSKLF